MKIKAQKVNEFGVPLFIDKSDPSQLRARVQLLKKAVKTGKGRRPLNAKDIERAKMHISWYSAELKKLGKKTSSKKAS